MLRSFTFVLLLIVCLACLGPIAAQDATGVTVTPYERNPIISVGEPGTWDSRGVGWPHVILHDGAFHMFYLGWSADYPSFTAVGYATSDDGLNWTKYAQNPVFTLDESAALAGVLGALPVLDGDKWVLYFTGSTEAGRPSRLVERATALSPTGPWSIDPAPVLEPGTSPDWDSFGALTVNSVVPTPNGFTMYYTLITSSTGDGPSYRGGGIGQATSPDGVHWTKYNDPSTTEPRYAVSDPVLRARNGSAAWDYGSVGGPVVEKSGDLWEMYYTGSGSGFWQIGHATSGNGVAWSAEDAPVIADSGHGYAPGSLVVTDDAEYFYYADWTALEDTIEIMVATVTHP